MNSSKKSHVLKELNKKEVYNLFKAIYEVSNFDVSSMEKESNALLDIFIQNNLSDCIIRRVNKNDISLQFSLTKKTYLLQHKKDHYEFDQNTYSLSLIDHVLMNFEPKKLYTTIELGWYLNNRICYSFLAYLSVDDTTHQPEFKIKIRSILFSHSYLEESFFNHFLFLVDSLITNNTFIHLSEENRNVIRLVMCYYTGTDIETLTAETLLSYRHLMEIIHE